MATHMEAGLNGRPQNECQEIAISWVGDPIPSSQCQDFDMFQSGDPDLNLHLPLLERRTYLLLEFLRLSQESIQEIVAYTDTPTNLPLGVIPKKAPMSLGYGHG